MFNTITTTITITTKASGGVFNQHWIERWVLQGDGQCGSAVRLHLPPVTHDPGGGTPPSSPQHPVILVTLAGRLDSLINPATGVAYPNMTLASSIISTAVSKGYAVALLSLCGFGEMGSDGGFGIYNSDTVSNPMSKYIHGQCMHIMYITATRISTRTATTHHCSVFIVYRPPKACVLRFSLCARVGVVC